MNNVGMNIRDFVRQKTKEQIVKYIIKREEEYKKLLIQNEAFEAQYDVDDKKLIELQTDINKLQFKLNNSIALNEKLNNHLNEVLIGAHCKDSEDEKNFNVIYKQYEDRIKEIKS